MPLSGAVHNHRASAQPARQAFLSLCTGGGKNFLAKSMLFILLQFAPLADSRIAHLREQRHVMA
jgi:hypothetical protein